MGYPLERKPRKDSQYETFTHSIGVIEFFSVASAVIAADAAAKAADVKMIEVRLAMAIGGK